MTTPLAADAFPSFAPEGAKSDEDGTGVRRLEPVDIFDVVEGIIRKSRTGICRAKDLAADFGGKRYDVLKQMKRWGKIITWKINRILFFSLPSTGVFYPAEVLDQGFLKDGEQWDRNDEEQQKRYQAWWRNRNRSRIRSLAQKWYRQNFENHKKRVTRWNSENSEKRKAYFHRNKNRFCKDCNVAITALDKQVRLEAQVICQLCNNTSETVEIEEER